METIEMNINELSEKLNDAIIEFNFIMEKIVLYGKYQRHEYELAPEFDAVFEQIHDIENINNLIKERLIG